MPKKKKTTSLSMPKISDVSKSADLEASEAAKALEFVQKLSLENNGQLESAVDIVSEIKKQREEVDNKRKSFVDPLRSVVKDIDNFFKPVLESLDTAEEQLKNRITGFIEKQELDREALLSKVEHVSDSESRSTLIELAGEKITPKIGGLSLRVLWDGEVIDMNQIPKEYTIPDLKALKARTKSMKGDPGIPGWKAFSSLRAAITKSGVQDE